MTSDVQKYLNLIQHDLKLFDLLTGELPSHLTQEDFSDWQVTNLFYIACIFLKSACALFGEDVQDHFTLRRIINERKELYLIAKNYRHLEEASRDARYEGRTFEKQYVLDRLVPKFNSVRDCIVDLLTKSNIQNIPTIEVESYLNRN